ncbi:hypothetical protein [Variovorax saccharolyticus]|uniref:hypothetical protein n=1 Tax=Variovorax saccharolyticus TaxID=3053516 RepID=UPI002577C123|nr:hypothetical protein [Variovorax sp. J22R187]MDM0018007.1 hypothetical protein [Variovorax sp. J22R187]
MDKKIAAYLLASLVQRINRDQIGSVSDQEKEALAYALNFLSDGDIPKGTPTIVEAPPAVVPPVAPKTETPAKKAPPPLPKISLDLRSLDHQKPMAASAILCLDFGTARSKAFASTDSEEHLDLELGKAAGNEGYTLPSSVFIAADEKAYFGAEAIDKSLSGTIANRERLDSIKSWLSLREEGDLDSEAVSENYNPTHFTLTEGDLIRIYLAYLTDMACVSLAEWKIDDEEVGRYVLRRFARPCGKNPKQAAWVDNLMKRLLAEAQILADTFHGKWSGGISIAEIKAAIEEVKSLPNRPDYLIAEGVPEPVAVAAGAVATSDNRIDAYMVVDAGAGTTDFGLFFVIRNKHNGDPKVFQVSASIKGLNQAGDKVDLLLQAFIRSKESIESTSISGKLVEADLRRRVRVWKELLFSNSKLDYVLADSTIGTITLEDFLQTPGMQQFSNRLEEGFRGALEMVDGSYLKHLATDPVRLQVILTGGSSKLTMMSDLAKGYIEVKGMKIRRELANAAPEWLVEEASEMHTVYPQLAVAIGGASRDLPSTDFGPEEFIRVTRPTYVAGSMRVTGT